MLLSPFLLSAALVLQPSALTPAMPPAMRRAGPLVACMPPGETEIASSAVLGTEQQALWALSGAQSSNEADVPAETSVPSQPPLVVLTCMTGAVADSACHTLVAEHVETITSGRDAGKSWLRPIALRMVRDASSLVMLIRPDVEGWMASCGSSNAIVTVFSAAAPPLFVPTEMLRDASLQESVIVRMLNSAHSSRLADDDFAQLETFMHL